MIALCLLAGGATVSLQCWPAAASQSTWALYSLLTLLSFDFRFHGLTVGLGVQDPNTELQPVHDSLVALSSRANPSNFAVVYQPFEDCRDILATKQAHFDLCFTSPPFFDYELYPGGERQSWQRYPLLADWLVRFLFTSMKMAWSALKDDGGALAIQITDCGGNILCEPMVLFASWRLPRCTFAGVVMTAPHRPVWVWKKATVDAFAPLPSLHPLSVRSCCDTMQFYYPDLHEKVISCNL